MFWFLWYAAGSKTTRGIPQSKLVPVVPVATTVFCEELSNMIVDCLVHPRDKKKPPLIDTLIKYWVIEAM